MFTQTLKMERTDQLDFQQIYFDNYKSNLDVLHEDRRFNDSNTLLVNYDTLYHILQKAVKGVTKNSPD